MLLGSERKLVMLSATGLSPSRVQHSLLLRLAARHLYSSPTTPFSRFRLLPFRSPLLRESLLLSFPLATKMFQFTRLSLACPWIQQQFESHAPPVSAFPKAPLSFKRIRGMSSPGGILNALATALHGSIRTAPSIQSFTARTTGVSNPIRSPSFRLSVSVSAQQSAFAVGVLSDLYAFHRSTGNSLCPYRTPAW
ncbi:hypothetical protein VNO80_32989 [Phaseolus coccineus]|uniref:Uncharacterized protein n=1 Tax=Phaseolus coccineus TaxID=3886 RepID=A0AAN9QCM6_PHACN